MKAALPCLLCAPVVLAAQTGTDPARAAAERLLAQDIVKMNFTTARGWSGTFEANLRTQKTSFAGSADRTCMTGNVPTEASYTGQELVLEFKPTVPGCTPVQFRFDPLSGSGEIYVSNDGRASWTKSSSGSKVSLVR